MKPKLFIIISSVFTILFVIAAAYDISPYLRGPAPYFPDWRWEYNFVNTYPHIWLPILVGSLILLLFYKIETKKKWFSKHESFFVCTIALLTFFFQFALLFANRAGINGLLSRIINPDVNGYFSTALHITSISDFLKNYNANVLSFSMHAQGHPPLAILFFYWINEFFKFTPFLNVFVKNVNPSTQLINQIWVNLSPNEKLGTFFSIILIPLLVSLTGILVYFIGKKLYNSKIAIRTQVALSFIPSVLLFIPINDAFISIFPLLSFIVFLKGIGTKNKLLFFLSGIVFSVGVYFSISLLPLVLIHLSYLISKFNFKKYLILNFGLYFLLGHLILPILLWIFFRFDSIKMFTVLMQGLPENRHYLTWVFYNLYDFFIFLGIPLTLTFIYLIVNQRKKIDILFVSFLLMLFIVNFSGSVRGEVARIWIPYVPFLLLPLVNFITNNKFSSYQFIAILILQLLLVLTINEYWVTFW